jgi:hypothetical protein
MRIGAQSRVAAAGRLDYLCRRSATWSDPERIGRAPAVLIDVLGEIA